MSFSNIEQIALSFEKLSLSKEKALETAKNPKIAPVLQDILSISEKLSSEISKPAGALLYKLSTTATPEIKPHFDFIINQILIGNLATNDQFTEALLFCKHSDPQDSYDAFKAACGVGIVVDDAQVFASVDAFLANNAEKLATDRYRTLGPFLSKLRQIPALRWAKAEKVKQALEVQVEQIIGPKDDRDLPQKGKSKKAPKPDNSKSIPDNAKKTTKQAEKPLEYTPASLESMFAEGDASKFHKPGGNPQISSALMDQHLKATNGKVITRFPPEPNGYLHIGHAKAINVNFGYAKAHQGICNLRYDDTNPEAEDEKYLISILDTIKWLGFEPNNIFYASNYFQQLFDLAVHMINKGLAYVCHCSGEEIHQQRGGESMGPRFACKHRDRPIQESLDQFYKMRDGRYAQGEATLRMKMDLEDGNPQMWDLIAYRVLYATHHRTGNDWCIYPTYDFAHCLSDSIENITHSLCTTEFTQSRKSYYWLCDAVDVYKPVQWEYGRLSVTNTILSKRKLLTLLNDHIVSDLDDPRLYTLPALRRRGVPAAAINGFVRELGVTTAKTTIDVSRLENHIRDCLNSSAPRLMAVLNPIKVRLTNFNNILDLDVPFKPRDPSFGSHTIPFTDTLYIDSSDFRLEDTKDYYRLAPNKTVGLLYAPGPITCTQVVYAPDGSISELLCKLEDGSDGNPIPKPKTYIQWVPICPERGSPVTLDQVRIYNNLFKHSNPFDKSLVPDGWLTDVNPNSLQTEKSAMIETGIFDLIAKFVNDSDKKVHFNKKEFEELRFQFLRIGYFCIDKDSIFSDNFADLCKNSNANQYHEFASNANIILNRIVTLKEDQNK
ncbi:hypothetical protein BB561_001678 [Smittium simulii]|uniref:glutamine--tRNA ligase n=1 Tax=Smittium simulii TaxID=133385 RepID=A0A2T9YTJ0_9FUNG|nr:hypothetical protein BB561_001678 [Smittium simulii]